MGTLRGSAILTGFFLLTLPLMPVQAVLVRFWTGGARRFPNWYHRQVCRLMGVSLQIEGEVVRGKPVLLVANHTSWLDIPVLSAVAPLSFVAKREVNSWPFVSSLARLQRTVFVDRTRRQSAGEAADAISERLANGDAIVLFAEGTSSDGNKVLPFKSSLFGAIKSDSTVDVVVQTIAVVYTHRNGIPMVRSDRPRVGWYGDMEMQSHAWGVLTSGPLAVKVRIGAPVPLQSFAGRKDLALTSERSVRKAVLAILRGREACEEVEPVEPDAESRRRHLATAAPAGEKWT